MGTVARCLMRSSLTLASAPLYDSFGGPRDDLPAYVRIAGELGAERVLDIGCGTGSLAILLAATGRAVVAADPAAAPWTRRSRKTGTPPSPGSTPAPREHRRLVRILR